VHRGFEPEESVVTVVGAEAPHSVICITDADDPDSPLHLLRSIAAGIANMGSNNAHIGGRGVVTVVVNPDHASVLERGGYDRAKVAEALCELAVNPRARLGELSPAIRDAGRPDDLISSLRRPEDLLLVHGGGGGLYSMVMPSWCAGPHANRAVSQRIDFNQACAIPGF
jgi:hypothetical protein